MPEPTNVPSKPDPTRARLLRSAYEPSSLESVAEAVSVATEDVRRIYVERLGNLYRWSLVATGGCYPLLRITARFLRADHYGIMIGFRTITGGLCVLCDDPQREVHPDAWAVLDFDGPATPAMVKDRMDTHVVNGIACPRCGQWSPCVDILAMGGGGALLLYECPTDGDFEAASTGDPQHTRFRRDV